LKENEGAQFWTKYLQPVQAIEYKPIAPNIEAQLDKYESDDLKRQRMEIKKKEQELAKIKSMDM